MKILKTGLLLVLFILVSAGVFAQSENSKNSSDYKIKVEFHCANGKQLLENKLGEVNGIVYLDVNLETKILDLKYDSSILNELDIIAAIEKIGYYTEFSDRSKKIHKACNHGDGEHHHHDDDHDHN